jgi:hypothetical protein
MNLRPTARILNLRNKFITSTPGSKLLESTIIPAAKYVERLRDFTQNQSIYDSVETHAAVIFRELKVLHGPFRGMQYPSNISVGSTLYPKLLGSYEMEISPVIEKLCNINFKQVIDIGSAEGYYAIGLAMRLNQAKVYAFDTNQIARQQCKEMAILNNVISRLSIQTHCSSVELDELITNQNSLIICDCEGYEKKLFNHLSAASLKRSTLLIEAHDFLDIEITRHLCMTFEQTHNIKIINSVDDYQKAYSYDFPELDGLSLAERRHLLAENRPSIMNWLYCTPLLLNHN